MRSELARTRALAQSLAADHRRIVAASVGANGDDEHDVEGASIAFELAHVRGLLGRAEARSAALTAALERIAAGAYGRCGHCGAPIGSARLDARPDAVTCISCAR